MNNDNRMAIITFRSGRREVFLQSDENFAFLRDILESHVVRNTMQL